MRKLICLVAFSSMAFWLNGQNLTIDGYVFQSGNRGFLNVVQVEVFDNQENLLKTVFSDVTGHFVAEVPFKDAYVLRTYKDMFEEKLTEISTNGKEAGEKLFVKLEMKRAPGYMFEITLAESRDADTIPVNAIQGARIEVYNNTKKEEVLALVDYPEPNFEVALIKGNHYTVLLRKEGFLSKRMEAFVDVEGCILCFEGIGSVEPGVSDNLSEGNQMGVLLANVEMERIYEGKTIPISNILYEYGSAELDRTDEDGLKALATLMSDNPDLTVEIGSHTDSRGSNERNFFLSQERAENVVNFLVDNGVDRTRLVSRGYGEDKLLNNCKGRVDCTEKEHSINRRTELKVIGIADVPAPIKTLAHIKQLEQSEALLDEIQFGGQVMVPAEEGSMDIDSIAKAEAKLNIEEDEAPPRPSTTSAPKVEKPMGSEDLQTNKITAEGQNAPVAAAIDSSIDTDFSEEARGVYKVIIHTSVSQLAQDDDLYKRHSRLEEIKKDDQFHYLIGDFEELADVNKYYNTAVKFAYPDAKIVTVINGEIQ